MTRILGLDYGDKRIGVAVSDPLGLTAQVVGVWQNDATILDQITTYVGEHNIQTILLGLPKNQHGSDSLKAKDVRVFGDQLKTSIGVGITYWDERFSTIAATKHLKSAGLNWKKRKSIIDSQAAVYILQGYLDSRYLR